MVPSSLAATATGCPRVLEMRTVGPWKPGTIRMRHFSSRCLWLFVVFLTLVIVGQCAAAEYSWRQPHAKVLPTGDLEWAPQPFVFQKGNSVRYIDFAGGNDAADGRTQQTAWKHHPWDPAATGNAAACKGIHTYVFKRGVEYRGQLIAGESGEAGNPIRLTSDPAWGEGEAVICGSQQVIGWSLGADHPDIPDAAKVAYVDLDFAPRNVWMVEDDGQVVRIPLARTPNWTVSDPDDVKSQWWEWDLPKHPWGARETVGGIEAHLGIDTKHLTGPAEYYEGAYIWSEYGWVMSTPYPTRVLKYDASRHAIAFAGQWGGGAGSYHVPRHARYYLEDKPHYLDEPGEFWFHKQGSGGRLYLRLPGDRDPNSVRVEAARWITLLDAEQMSHVHISGLTFRFTNVYWDLDAPPTRHKDVDPACIRLLGSGDDLTVANCLFEHVHLPIRMKAVGDDARIDHVVIRDNAMRYTDHGAVWLADGGAWGAEHPQGRLYDVQVLRNSLFQIGLRPSRYGHGHAIEIDCAETAEVAGNVGHRLYGSGIFVFGGKRSGAKADRPLVRILIHHNKIVDSLLNNNDWGGIETWQGGPAYVYNNVSGNPRGFKMWGYKLQPDKPATSSFGHAYYMDGGFKQYYFNNIAWGKSKDPFGPLGNCSAFQEIHGFLASIFNNTVYNFVIGSRRQAPEAGRNKYLGNIWHSLGEMVFRHADPSNSPADPNAADAGPEGSSFDHRSNAYAGNVFFDVPEKFGVFESDGRWHADADGFRKALARRKSLGDLGRVAEQSPLVAPAAGDFRPTEAAADQGVRVFVPWGLYATVAEWPFYHAGDDPAEIVDEHFHLAPYYVNREDYRKQPMYPLRAVGVGAEDYVQGPLEDWVHGALRLNGRNQYAVLPNSSMDAAAEVEAFTPKNRTYDWITFDVPEKAVPGRPLEVKVHLKGAAIDATMKLRADLHWSDTAGRFGGMNAYGGAAKDVAGPGPYVFRFTPVDKPRLRNFIITVWLSPTGEWADRKQIAQHQIAKATAAPEQGYRSPQVHNSNFLIELCFRTEPGAAGGVLIEKMERAGYSLTIGQDGAARFLVRGPEQRGGRLAQSSQLDATQSSQPDATAAGSPAAAQLVSQARLCDGRWHHLVAEADRAARTLVLYVDGRRDSSGPGIGPDVSLANEADLYVGGTPQGRCLAATFEFARIALGTLADAKTTIDELYAWQFHGPFLSDWNGRPPADGRRDAGAIERTGSN